MQAQTPNELYPEMIWRVFEEGAKVPSRLDETLEIRGMCVEVADPRNRLVTSWCRPVNVAFALAEVLWILGGRNDVETLEFYNSQIKEYSDNGTTFNAAYGQRLRSVYGHDQIEDVYRALAENPETRQATLVITCPAFDRNYEANGEKRQTKDRACNLISHLLIRDGALQWMQVIRSNDALWGTPYNWMQFMHLQEYFAARLGVGIGAFTYVAHSFHIYGYHFEEAQGIKSFDLYQELGATHAPMGDTDLKTVQRLLDAEEGIRTGQHIMPSTMGLSLYWKHVLAVLRAHRQYRIHENELAYLDLIQGDPILAAAQIRFYWNKRWHKQAEAWLPLLERDWSPSIVQWMTGVSHEPQTVEVAAPEDRPVDAGQQERQG
jgi:thymidylate synthase